MKINEIIIRKILSKYNNIQPHQQEIIQWQNDYARCLVVGCHGNSNCFTKTLVVNKNANMDSK